MNSEEQIFKQLEFLAQLIPTPIYWSDINGALLGANEADLKAVGAGSLESFLGKTPYEYYPYDIADNLMQHVQKVIEAGEPLTQEDKIKDITTGKIKYFTATRSPIRNEQGEIIGILGTSIDITAEKEAEMLRHMNRELELEEHKKFRKIADQMAHDLGSPLMALSVLTSSCAGIPEKQRNMLKESASRIRDIAGSLLSQYKPSEEYVTDNSNSDELLVYAALEQILMDKQYEYQHLPIRFTCEYSKDSLFSFIKADAIAFKRMLSNLINNSVDAIDNTGNVIIKIYSDDNEVNVNITDTGKGIPPKIIDKILNNTPVTFGKEDGHGIGFNQIHEVLNHYKGRLFIDSKLGYGTTIKLTFPKIPVPEWLAKDIILQSNDTVLILDDDNSIHGAWDIRFNEVLRANPSIQVKHFTQAIDVINFIDNIENKDNIVLLSDYELLRQKLNGLDVIERTMVKRSVLVTSHYTDIEIRRQAYKMNTKILPKLLASEINITV